MREVVATGFSQADMKAEMDKSKQALLPKAHCGSGRVAPERGVYRGMNAATSLIGGTALARRTSGFVRDVSAWYAATRERDMQA